MIKPRLVRGLHLELVRIALRIHVLLIAILIFKNPIRAVQHLIKLLEADIARTGLKNRKKWIQFKGKYFTSFAIAGWPSPAFSRYIRNQLKKISQPEVSLPDTLLFAITHKCGFSCEHCLVWDDLNKKDPLSKNQINTIIHRFHHLGINQVIFSGGEPIQRFQDMISLIKGFPKDLQSWTFSNGYLMTNTKAQQLRNAGLQGVIFSLDHHLAPAHDQFRGVPGSFEKVLQAVEHCHHAGLMTCFSLCVTHQMANRAALDAYATLASTHGVHMILLMEPKAIGHYSGKAVQLNRQEQQVLEDFYMQLNSDSSFAKLPIVLYQDYYNRYSTCTGSGQHYLYVNAEGFIQACPFCTHHSAHALDENLADYLVLLKNQGCGSRKTKHSLIASPLTIDV